MMFELLDTTGCHYLYDAVENQIVPISEEDAGKLSAYIKGTERQRLQNAWSGIRVWGCARTRRWRNLKIP